MAQNIEINYYNGEEYEVLYPSTLGSLISGSVAQADNATTATTATNSTKLGGYTYSQITSGAGKTQCAYYTGISTSRDNIIYCNFVPLLLIIGTQGEYTPGTSTTSADKAYGIIGFSVYEQINIIGFSYSIGSSGVQTLITYLQPVTWGNSYIQIKTFTGYGTNAMNIWNNQVKYYYMFIH